MTWPSRGSVVLSPEGTRWFVVEHPETGDGAIVDEWGKWYDTLQHQPEEWPQWFIQRYGTDTGGTLCPIDAATVLDA